MDSIPQLYQVQGPPFSAHYPLQPQCEQKIYSCTRFILSQCLLQQSGTKEELGGVEEEDGGVEGSGGSLEVEVEVEERLL